MSDDLSPSFAASYDGRMPEEERLDVLPFPSQAFARDKSPCPAFSLPISRQDVNAWFEDQTSDSPFRRYVNPHLGELLAKLRLDKEFVRGEGCDLYDASGRAYLDCISAYGALPFGFNPPEIWRALRDVEARGEPSFVQPSLLGAAGELARRLLEIAPDGMRYVTFANSGAEAVEAAIKMCRLSTGRQGVLSTVRGFHGKTLGALSATGNADYQAGCGAPASDFHSIPYGDAEALRQELSRRPDYYAAFLVEPIQGEGGIVEPPPGYLAEVRRICTQAGVLLVFDEIQSGLGRTGAMFCCQQEGAVPDVITLAKALGGGLIPIGAVLSSERAYNERFALKHSSTFAGNALACRAGLAALEMLTRDGGFLLDRVALYGARLKLGLKKLQKRYPQLIEEVRGRGFMLGLKFTSKRDAWPDGLLAIAAEQSLLTPIFSSYMLNVEGVRVAPTLNGGAVVRIEPALTIRWAQCQRLLNALERALEVFAEGDMGRILGSIFDGAPRKSASHRQDDVWSAGADDAPARVPVEQAEERALSPRANETRFGFLAHPLMFENFTEFDPSLGSLSEQELELVSEDLVELVDPFVRTRTRVVSRTGKSVYGEFLMLPWTADQWKRMRRKEASDRVVEAVKLAGERGAQIVGLGAFTSIVTAGGVKCEDAGVAVTTGNSYTAVASAEAIGMALARLGESWSASTSVAIVGAAGAIGRAMALLLSENVGRLVLVGNPDSPALQVRQRMAAVAADVCRHIAARRDEGVSFLRGTWQSLVTDRLPQGEPISEQLLGSLIAELEESGALAITQDLKAAVRGADVVVTATSATECILEPADLRRGAVVCDLSRPANVSAATAAQRPDVLVIDGGVIAAPGSPYLGQWGLGHGLAFACMAETMMLALEDRLENTSLGADLNQETLRYFQSAARRHGFSVARLRSFGKILTDADWDRILQARRSA